VPLSGLEEGGSLGGQGSVEWSSGGRAPLRRRVSIKSQGLSRASKTGGTGGNMQQPTSESDTTVECSGRMTLECGCGERLILLGLKEDWLSEKRTNFECLCGLSLTLADRLDEDVVQEFSQVMRGAFKTPASQDRRPRVYRRI
jgi:hypothetical protein